MFVNFRKLTVRPQDPEREEKDIYNIRKTFHIFAIAVFLPGLYFDKEMLFVASSCALVVFIMLEVNVFHVNLFFSSFLRIMKLLRSNGQYLNVVLLMTWFEGFESFLHNQ